MTSIPQHCIEKFINRFNQYPSQINLELTNDDKTEKFFKKSPLIWFNSNVIEQKILYIEKLIEFDATGIYVYINYDNNKYVVTFLTTIDRENVTNYTIKQLIK